MCLLSKKQFGIGLIVLALPLLNACAATSRLYPNEVPENSLRVVEVIGLATRLNIDNNRYMREPLAAAGFQDAEIQDGSVGAGRVYCCGGKMDDAFFNYFYIPADIEVEAGDIVEIRNGSVSKGGKSSVNTLVRVVQKKDDPAGTCSWRPPEGKYDRVLYCDWMPQKGWVKYKGTWVSSK